MHMAKVVVKLLNGDYANEGGMVADLLLMVENCRRCVRLLLGLPTLGSRSPFAYLCSACTLAVPA